MKMKRAAIVFAASTLAAAGAYAGDYPRTQSQSESLPQASESLPQQQEQSANSELIIKAQEALHARGYDAGPIEGVQTEQMTDAVKQAQIDSQLEPTGELDGQTLAALGVIGPESGSEAVETPSS
jgi:peptidoglycan hydrolase-like protein with peptidoglycan-binding domain